MFNEIDSGLCSGIRGLETSFTFKTFSIIKRNKQITVYFKYITFSIKHQTFRTETVTLIFCKTAFLNSQQGNCCRGTYLQFVLRRLLSLTYSRLSGKYCKFSRNVAAHQAAFYNQRPWLHIFIKETLSSSGVSFP